MSCALLLGVVVPAWAHGDQLHQQHITTIVNQVRGHECCSPGGENELKQQLETLDRLQMKATFAVRWDALRDPGIVTTLKKAKQNGHEIAGFLEITPQLASQSGVLYTGTPENWYHAEHAYLLGYEPADRAKIIASFMDQFKRVFGTHPTTTVAWMIDTPSLQLLHKQYGVTVHEVTREQWGTDSYTLSGGPAHYPYHASEQWALIPDEGNSETMPLIIRQTITDPVWNYGDRTNSYTSQPNDYRLKERGFPYFSHLFRQAHDQPTENQTFALLGLENSMPQIDQEEFAKQLGEVASWRKDSPSDRLVLRAQDLPTTWQDTSDHPVRVYQGHGTDSKSDERAWWFTSNHYRARLRLSEGQLFLSDIRVYDPNFIDPYAQYRAESAAYWVVPFLLDGSRFFVDDATGTLDEIWHDELGPDRKPGLLPQRLILSDSVKPQEIKLEHVGDQLHFKVSGKTLLALNSETLWLPEHEAPTWKHSLLTNVLKGWQWQTRTGEVAWELKKGERDTNTQLVAFTPVSRPELLTQERLERYPLLLPELKVRPLQGDQTVLQVNNRFAQAGRNPVRIVFQPRDTFGYPILTNPPEVTTDNEVYSVTQQQPHGSNGMIFIDVMSTEAKKVVVTIKAGEAFTRTETIYFAPNCKQELKTCVQQPKYLWWYLRNWVGDKQRAWEENRQ